MHDDRDLSEAPHPAAQCVLLCVWNAGEAMLIRQLLDSYGISCQASSDVPYTVLPLSMDGLGEIRILVAARDLADAQRLLADHRRQGMRVLRGGRSIRRRHRERQLGASGNL